MLVAAIGFFTSSCEKDSSLKSTQIELLSYGPAGVKHGEDISFIGNNLDKVTAIEFTGATVTKDMFKQQTSQLIVVAVPMAALRGKVTLKSDNGDVISKAPIDFEVPVTITSVTASARPGDNISIKGDHVNWISSVTFSDGIVVADKDFVSKALNEIVVKVPVAAKTGPLIFNTGGTEPLTINTEGDLLVTLPAITALSPNPIDRGGNLTITGTNLDLTKGIFFKGVADTVKQFVSKTANQIVVKVPATANKGKISLVAYSGVKVESQASLLFIGDLPDLQPLGAAIYIDALQGSWQNWGWGSTADFSNTENVRDGANAIKMVYNGSWGALKFANSSVATAPYSEITFSIYGATGTNGNVLNVATNAGTTYPITIQAGKWVEYKLTKANLGNPANITELVFQDTGWSGTIYIDHVGLR